MKVHIEIVTGQAMANLLPILAIQPDVVALLTSDSMLSKQKILEDLIKQTPQLAQCKVQVVPGLPDSGIRKIQNFGLEIRMQLEEQYPAAEFIYDLTGGSKLMAVALASIFSDQNYSQLYLNTENNLLEYVEPQEKEAEQLNELINAKTYLAANGATWRYALSEKDEWLQKVKRRKALTFSFATMLAKHTLDMQKFISQLNKAASQSTERTAKLVSPQQQINFLPKSCRVLLKQIAENELIDWQQDNEMTVYFRSEDSINYLNGGWLEEYFYLVAEQVSLADSHCGVKISDTSIKKTDSHNDLDGLCAYNNRLLLVECKTAKFGQDTQKDNNILYKIDSIASHIGGQFCTRLLLSALPVDHVTRNNREVNVSARAKSVEVEILSGQDVLKLKDHLEYWKTHGKWKA